MSIRSCKLPVVSFSTVSRRENLVSDPVPDRAEKSAPGQATRNPDRASPGRPMKTPLWKHLRQQRDVPQLRLREDSEGNCYDHHQNYAHSWGSYGYDSCEAAERLWEKACERLPQPLIWFFREHGIFYVPEAYFTHFSYRC